MEREMATMVGSPSGTAATISTMLSMKAPLMVVKVISPAVRMCTSWMMKMIAANTPPTMVMSLPRRPIFSCSGVCPLASFWISRAMRPNWVRSPTSVTTILPVPPVMKVPEYTILTRSATGVSGSCSSAAASFSTGTDSPVREDSSQVREELSSSLPSAAALLPVSR